MRIVQATARTGPFLSADGHEIDGPLYHGTTLEAWENGISKHGLDPDKSEDYGEDTETKGYIFVTEFEQEARNFAPGGSGSNATMPGAIIQIELDADLASKIRTVLGEHLRCPVLIPPSRLKLVDTTNVRPPAPPRPPRRR